MSADAVSVESDTPVAVVVHRRIAAEHDREYAVWQERVGARVAQSPGFLAREVIPPQPPQQDAWVVVQHFRTLTAAQDWLASDARRDLLAEIGGMVQGNDEIRIVAEAASRADQAASAMISHRVEPQDESAFLSWQAEISAAEARWDGFLGHRIERPILGVQQEWVVVVTFASTAQLDAWIASPERAALVSRSADFASDVRIDRMSHGFGFWSPNDMPDPVFKSNLLVLLMLYPLVFLWGYFVSAPLIDSHGVPFWLSLFIGNVVSTQLLGWFLVPFAFRRFRWWLKRHRTWQVHLAGYAILIALYVISMAVFAWLAAIRG